MTSPEEPRKQPELLKYGSEAFANYVDASGDVRPISDLSSDEMDDALQDYAEQRGVDMASASEEKQESSSNAPKSKKRVKKIGRRAFGLPAVGEEGRLLNIPDHSGAQTPEDIRIAREHGDIAERNIMIRMSGEMQDALERGDVETAARVHVEMEKRRKRREELGYGQVDISTEE